MSFNWFNLGKKTVNSDLEVRQIGQLSAPVPNSDKHHKTVPKLSLVKTQDDVFFEKYLPLPPENQDIEFGDEVKVINSRSPAPLSDAMRYGVRFSPVSIESPEDLISTKLGDCINETLGISPQLFATIAVVKLSESSKEVALLLSQVATQDVVTEVIRLLPESGLTLAKNGWQAWSCSASIIMSISQGHLDDKIFNAIRRSRPDEKSALWQSFVAIAQAGFDNGANDIDYIFNSTTPMSQVAFKIEGRYLKPEKWKLPSDTVFQILGAAWQKIVGGNDAIFQPKIEQQGQLYLELANRVKVRLRWNGMSLDNGCVVTLRMHRMGNSNTIKSLEQCGYLPWHMDAFKRAIESRGGLTTLAGTVGSGKTLTLAILMGMFPSDRKKISFEDPVEIDQLDTHQKSIIRDLVQSGSDGDAAFVSGVRSIFRSALDVFMLGEVRDIETGRVVRAVFESGHSTLTTTHTNSATGIFNKFISPQIGIPLDVLGTPGNIRLNVYQALVSTTCLHCGRSPADYAIEQKLTGHKLSEHHRYIERIESLFGFSGKQLRLRNPFGCVKCRKIDLPQLNGLTGRTVVAEMVEPDDDMLELVLAGKKIEVQRYWRSLSDGNIESDDLAGKTVMEVAMYKASKGILDPREIESQFESFAGLAHKHATTERLSKKL